MKKFYPIRPNKKREKIVITIRIDENKVEQIDEIAYRIDISRNELINQCIDYALENIEFNEYDYE